MTIGPASTKMLQKDWQRRGMITLLGSQYSEGPQGYKASPSFKTSKQTNKHIQKQRKSKKKNTVHYGICLPMDSICKWVSAHHGMSLPVDAYANESHSHFSDHIVEQSGRMEMRRQIFSLRVMHDFNRFWKYPFACYSRSERWIFCSNLELKRKRMR